MVICLTEVHSQLALYVIHNIDEFINFGKKIEQNLHAKQMWNTQVGQLEQEFSYRADTKLVLRYMQQLYLMVRDKRFGEEPHAVISNNDVVCFPNCFVDTPALKLTPTDHSLYIDFRDFFCTSYFLQLIQDISRKCNGEVKIESPYYVVVRERCMEMHVEYIPQKTLLHCVVW